MDKLFVCKKKEFFFFGSQARSAVDDLRLEEEPLERNFPTTIPAALETKPSALGEPAAGLWTAEVLFLRKNLEPLGCNFLRELFRDDVLGMLLLAVVVLCGDEGA